MRNTDVELYSPRFFSKVEKSDDCWLWTGSITRDGYGHFRYGHKNVGAHRFSYLLANGKIPKKLAVCHACDVRHCVNPKHLFLGSWKDNAMDCVIKGRRARKLSVEQVIKIRADKETSHRQLAREYGVDPALIRRIRRGERWTVLPAIPSAPTFIHHITPLL